MALTNGKPGQKSAVFDAFLKLDNVKGESLDDKHKDEIEIFAWNWDVENLGTAGIGSGQGTGKVKVHDLQISKRADASTPVLLKSCVTGDHIGNGVLTVRKAGGSNQLEYYKINFTDLFVSQIEMYTHDESPVLLEEVHLNFTTFKLTYTQQGAQGAAGKSGDFGYDLTKNKAI